MYRRNPDLRGEGEEIRLEPAQLLEIEKCKHDPRYFLENYFYIHSVLGAVKFPLRPRQVQELDAIRDNKLIKGDWYRQAGYTTLVLGYMLWACMFQPKYAALYMAPKRKGAEGYFKSIVREMYLRIPYWMQPGVTEWTAQKIRFCNGSVFCARAELEKNTRGIGWDFLFLDDFGCLTDRAMRGFTNVVFPGYEARARAKLVLGGAHRFGRQRPANLTFWENCTIPFHVSEHTWKDDPRLDDVWASTERQRIGYFAFRQRYEGEIFVSVPSKEHQRSRGIEWIPTSERLPDMGARVLVTIEHSATSRETCSAIFYGSRENPQWDDGTGEYYYDDSIVLAWAERPEPYRGAKHAD